MGPRLEQTKEELLSQIPAILNSLEPVLRDKFPTLQTADIKDVMQQAALNAIEHIDTYRREADLQTWIFRILYNSAIQHLRRDKIKNKYLTRQDEILQGSGASLKHEDPDRKIYFAQLIKDHFSALDETDLEICKLYYIEDSSVDEIATALNTKRGTILSRLSRARAKLKESLAKKGDSAN